MPYCFMAIAFFEVIVLGFASIVYSILFELQFSCSISSMLLIRSSNKLSLKLVGVPPPMNIVEI